MIGPFVQLGGHVVRGRTDHLHPAVEGAVIGLRALEGREEGVVDVDRPTGVLVHELRREDLHVTSQHHEIDVLSPQKLPQLGFLLRLRLGSDR